MDPIESARSRLRHFINGRNLSIVAPSNTPSHGSDSESYRASSSDDEFVPGPLDVEACRDFIVFELGEEERLPNRETYADGIQEVRSRLMARYGDERIGQAMRIMYDLIENKDNAHGVGDFGDIWAPWRHDHMHRHENFSQPNTPRFPNLILPDTRRWSEIVSVTKVSQALLGDVDCSTRDRFNTTVPMAHTRKPLVQYPQPRSNGHRHASSSSHSMTHERLPATIFDRPTGEDRTWLLNQLQAPSRASQPMSRRYRDKGVQVSLGPPWSRSFEERGACDGSGKQHKRHNIFVSDAFKRLGLIRSPDSNRTPQTTMGDARSARVEEVSSTSFRENIGRRLSRGGRQRKNAPPRLPAIRAPAAMKWEI